MGWVLRALASPCHRAATHMSPFTCWGTLLEQLSPAALPCLMSSAAAALQCTLFAPCAYECVCVAGARPSHCPAAPCTLLCGTPRGSCQVQAAPPSAPKRASLNFLPVLFASRASRTSRASTSSMTSAHMLSGADGAAAAGLDASTLARMRWRSAVTKVSRAAVRTGRGRAAGSQPASPTPHRHRTSCWGQAVPSRVPHVD